MLFMVWEDSGSSIKAYCVPDSFTSYARLKVFAAGRHLTTLAPNAFNEHMVGRHKTGQVGFEIDGSIVPGLADLTDLELRDETTDILVYRRTPASPIINQAVFRLETSLLPLFRFDQVLQNRFRFWYDRLDMHSAETARQILAFHHFTSLYSSGRLLYSNYDFYLYEHQKSIVLLQDPYEELAERLLIFQRLGSEDLARLLSDRDLLYYAPMIQLSKQLKHFDEKEVRRVLRNADPDALAVLSNPVVRQLTANTPDEMADNNSLSKSLRVLSEFAIIGLRSQFGEFTAAVADMLDVDPSLFGQVPDNPIVSALAERLRQQSWLERFLEHDLNLYASIESAMASVR